MIVDKVFNGIRIVEGASHDELMKFLEEEKRRDEERKVECKKALQIKREEIYRNLEEEK